MLRGRGEQMLYFELPGKAKRFEFDWASSAEAEKRSRTRYAHHTIHPNEVQREVDASRTGLGSPDDVAGFVRTALEESGAIVIPQPFGFTVEPVGCQSVWTTRSAAPARQCSSTATYLCPWCRQR